MPPTKTVTDLLENIPVELRTAAVWLPYYLKRDPARPEKKPGKHPTVKYAEPADRKANLKSLDKLLKNPPTGKFDGFQRWIDPDEGFTFVDIDNVRDPETGVVDEWAEKIINELDTYCEISASGKGFHLVTRARIAADYHTAPDQLEIYAGNTPNKLLAMTGDVHPFFLPIADRQPQIDALMRRAVAREFNKIDSVVPGPDAPAPKHWTEVFHRGKDMDQKPGRVFIEGFLEEGVTFIGSLSGVGKTWLGLSIAHALTTAEPLFGRFKVKEPTNVLYLVPEVGPRKFRERMVKMRIPMDRGFYCQTIRDGACDLANPYLLQAVADGGPVVILDTAIRFQTGDENQATDQARGLAAQMFNLITCGAGAVICMHHRSKAAGHTDMTLENVLRGSGDFGAMADCVWGVEHARIPDGGIEGRNDTYHKQSKDLTRLYLECVKPRDMEPADPFVIQGRPYIDELGDFRLLSEREPPGEMVDGKDDQIEAFFESHPKIGKRAIGGKLSVGTDRVNRVARERGWVKEGELWVKT